jgi:hypothetical protein
MSTSTLSAHKKMTKNSKTGRRNAQSNLKTLVSNMEHKTQQILLAIRDLKNSRTTSL